MCTHRTLGHVWAPQWITYPAAFEGGTWEEVCRVWHMGWFAHVNLVNLELCLPNSLPCIVLGYHCPKKFFVWAEEKQHNDLWVTVIQRGDRGRGAGRFQFVLAVTSSIFCSSSNSCPCWATVAPESRPVTRCLADLPWASFCGYTSVVRHAWLCYWLSLIFQLPTWTFTFSSPPIIMWELMFHNKSLTPQCTVVLLPCLNPEIPSGKGLLITRRFLLAKALHTGVGDILYEPLFFHYQLIDWGKMLSLSSPIFCTCEITLATT